MVKVLVLPSFAFLSLGVGALKIMGPANPRAPASSPRQMLDGVSLWRFVLPLGWAAFASACSRAGRGSSRPRLAQATGVILAGLSFFFLAAVTFLLSLARG